MSKSTDPALRADVAMEPYWEAARDGRLLLKHCASCDKCYYYPRPLCPFCMGDDTQWREANGDGTIYSWSVERRAATPFSIAFVTLSEGPTLLTSIVDADLDSLAIGQAVKMGFETRDEQPVPVFRPA